MPKKWKNLESKQLFGNEIFGFREDKVQSPKTDKVHPVWVMDAPNWINIIPITAEKKVVLIKQYRFGSQEITLALYVEKSFDQNLDGMEDIEVIEVNLEEVTELIREGKIDHALVICAFYFFNQYKETSIDV